MNLSALDSKWNLNTPPAFPVVSVSVLQNPVYLLDTAGNFLTDPQGNRLIAYYNQTFSSTMLNALGSNNLLNAR